MRGVKGEGRWIAAATWRVAVPFTLLALRASPVAAQAPGTYVEHAVTTVAVRSADAEVTRTIVRDGRYAVTHRGDTVVVQAIAFDLATTTADETVRHDTDGFVGGRWKLLPATDGRWRVVETPFVPAALADVLDLAGLMADFFPPMPPAGLAVGDTAAGPGLVWERLPGDGLVARHAWTAARESDTTRLLGDSLPAVVREQVSERGEGEWNATTALTWTRRTVSLSESTVAERRIRARVEEEVRVVRQS